MLRLCQSPAPTYSPLQAGPSPSCSGGVREHCDVGGYPPQWRPPPEAPGRPPEPEVALHCRRLVAVCDLADDGRVVSKLHDGVGAVCGHAVVCEQGVEERAEHAALRGSGVEDQGGGCDVSHPHCLGSAS